jgi:hypothetical protein
MFQRGPLSGSIGIESRPIQRAPLIAQTSMKEDQRTCSPGISNPKTSRIDDAVDRAHDEESFHG